MNYIKTILFISFLFTTYAYSSSYTRVDLSVEHWAEMSRIGIRYTQAIENFKQGNPTNFESIFDDMKCLAAKLSTKNESQKYYQQLIEDRKKAVEKLKNSNY